MKAASFLGRILFGGFFLYNGINHLKNRAALAQYAKAKEVPEPDLAVVLSGLTLLVGGGSLVLGVKPRIGVLPIVGFLAVVSPAMHDFWNSSPETRQNDMIHFSKNMALLGAALALLGKEEWPLSIAA